MARSVGFASSMNIRKLLGINIPKPCEVGIITTIQEAIIQGDVKTNVPSDSARYMPAVIAAEASDGMMKKVVCEAFAISTLPGKSSEASILPRMTLMNRSKPVQVQPLITCTYYTRRRLLSSRATTSAAGGITPTPKLHNIRRVW